MVKTLTKSLKSDNNMKSVCLKSSQDVEVLTTKVMTTDVMTTTPEVEVFDTKIDSLDDYFLLNLFSYLSLKEKLAVERVCKRWQTIVRQLLDKQWALGTTWSADEDHKCLDANRDHCVSGGDIRDAIEMSNGWFYDLTHEKTLKKLESISHKCHHIRCLHISHCIIDLNCFERLVHMFPHLQCLHLKNNVLKSVIDENDNRKSTAEEWHSIGVLLGPLLRHLSVDPHYEFRMNENEMKSLLKHMTRVEELRIGTHFEREVTGDFISLLSPKCRLFYSLGRELSMEGLDHLARNQSQSLTHLSYFSNSLRTTDSLAKIGTNFLNLVKLKINLSFNEVILTSSSPISGLNQLKELSIDMNAFSDAHVDDGLIWCIKDGLSSVQVLEISRACLSIRAFNAINWCLPQLNQLVLKTIQIQCICQLAGELRDRTERYNCSTCRERCWQSVANYSHLKELQLMSYYFRSDKPKAFHKELSQLLPQFKCLRSLSIFRYDISSSKLFESLNQLMKDTEPDDRFILRLKSIPMDSSQKTKTPKVSIIRDSFML